MPNKKLRAAHHLLQFKQIGKVKLFVNMKSIFLCLQLKFNDYIQLKNNRLNAKILQRMLSLLRHHID